MSEPLDVNGSGGAPAPTVRRGFLPIVTNWFDRVFVAIYVFVALELLWMRFLEHALPLTFCHVLAVVVGVLIVWKG
jgi:predicted small integral membrane protein